MEHEARYCHFLVLNEWMITVGHINALRLRESRNLDGIAAGASIALQKYIFAAKVRARELEASSRKMSIHRSTPNGCSRDR
jgi:hypothetical protein